MDGNPNRLLPRAGAPRTRTTAQGNWPASRRTYLAAMTFPVSDDKRLIQHPD
jgi:hypothetical protein